MRKTVTEIKDLSRALTTGDITWKDVLPAFYGTSSIVEAIEGVLASISAATGSPPVQSRAFSGRLAMSADKAFEALDTKLKAEMPGFSWVTLRPFMKTPSLPSYAIGVWNDGAVRVETNKENMSGYMITSAAKRRESFDDWINAAILPPNSRKGTVYMMVNGPSGLDFQEVGIAGVELEQQNYTQDALEKYQRIVRELTSVKPFGRLNILEGPPGCGKSWAIRGLLYDCSLSATMVIVPPNLVAELTGPSGLGTILDFRQDHGDRPLVFILEDADEVLAPRNGYNMSGISSLLAMGDGLVGSTMDIRIVATTNATQTELDEAVKRPGRLNVMCHVGPLPAEQASIVFKRLTGNDEQLPELTLAEVYQRAYDSKWKAPEDKTSKTIGFQ